MQQYIGFYLNDCEYTIPILKVREIVNMPAITKMPQTPDYIEGVTNLRGAIIPIVNLKSLIRLDGNGSKSHKVIVVASGKMTFGILVDGITGVINISESEIEYAERLMNDSTEQIEGVVKLNDRLVVLLDTRKVLPCDDAHLFEDVIGAVNNKKGSNKVEVVKTIQTMAGEMQVKDVCDTREFFEKKGIDSNDPRYVMFDDIFIFMNAVANGDYEKADSAIQNIMKKGQGDLYKEVGKVTRKLHESIKGFKEAIDPKLKGFAISDMPNAVDRLQFVIEKTEEAANKTMGIVENHILKIDDVASHIRNISGPQESVDYLKAFKDRLEDDLTEILTTQSFQDLTGQTIKKVIKLVGEIEEELVRLITTFGVKIDHRINMESPEAEMISQSGVDDLLREFGF